ncbi:MAG: DDE-type integrase/transposase/recombinase, partial [Cyanobacteria bacterium J06553_1]
AREVVRGCVECQSIDPAPEKWRRGSLEVERVWQRLAMDITHVGGRHFLTMIDCGPSRFAIWRSLRWQTTEAVVAQLEGVFFEHGPPEEILTDNDTAFRSRQFTTFAEMWGVRLRFRAAHVPSGNGIAERCHRTVKTIAARKECSIGEAVHLYNVTPRDDCTSDTAPANVLYRYTVRVRAVDTVPEKSKGVSRYQCGDLVWVRPPDVRCDQRYTEGIVTRTVSEQTVEVDGMPRHVKHLRPRDGRVEEQARQDGVDAASWGDTDDDEWDEREDPMEEVEGAEDDPEDVVEGVEEADGVVEEVEEATGVAEEVEAVEEVVAVRRSARLASRGPAHRRCTVPGCCSK